MQNIYLVGFMGTGKSFVGKILAGQLNAKFIEMDEELERRAGKKIVDIFKDEGEANFRLMERMLLEELAKQDGNVVSCGGGAVCNDYNLALVKTSGFSFNLQSSPEKIYERTKKNTDRPLLQVENPLLKIKELLSKREPFYAQADHHIKSEEETPQQVADAIMNILKQHD
jgi:shikimate kinase